MRDACPPWALTSQNRSGRHQRVGANTDPAAATVVSVSDILAACGAGLAVLVELIEAFAIVLAVGSTRSWRDAWLGAAAAAVACAAVAVVVGPVVLEQLGLQAVRLVIGSALLWFGFGWLRKNTLR